MNIIILAGGIGTRLWPLGRRNNPKQFFPMVGKEPLIKETYNRFRSRYEVKNIYFSVTKDLYEPLKKLFPQVPKKQYIVEPSRRDTAPAMGYAAAVLSLINKDEPFVFAPADHFILDEKKFLDCFEVGEQMIKQTGKLLDIGIAATFPSTVLGYSKIGKEYKKIKNISVHYFAGHTEKPNLKTATRYLKTGAYLWHGNYYMWTPAKFLEAFQRCSPQHFVILEQIIEALKAKQIGKITKLYNTLEKISFDYAVTEKLKPAEVLIMKGEFGWSDVGAWDVLHDCLRERGDDKKNVIRGNVIAVDTEESLLYASSKKILATLGLKNFIVIDTPDALLVCPKNRAQEVKAIIKQLEEEGLHNHL